MRVTWLVLCSWMLGLAPWAASRAEGTAGDVAPAAEAAAGPGLLDLDDAPRSLPRATPSTTEADRQEALVLFAAGRMKANRQDFLGALRLYQRALRCDPTALEVLREIIPLALELHRPAEALRYALKAVELDPSNVPLLQRLGVYLTEKGDFAGAVKLYEKALAQRPPGAPLDENGFVLRFEVGRLHYLMEDYPASADSFAQVSAALAAADPAQLPAAVRKALLDDPSVTWSLFGDAFLKAGRTDEAAAAFHRAHAASGDRGVLGYQLGRVHLAAGQPDEALTELDHYFQAHGSSQGPAPYEALDEALRAQGQEAELIGRLEALLQDDPDNVPLGYYLAERHIAASGLDQAEKLLARLVDSSPTAAGFSSLAAIYRQMNRPGPLLEVLGKLAATEGDLDALGDELKTLAAEAPLVDALLELAHQRIEADGEGFGIGSRLAAAELAMEARRFDRAGEFYQAAIASDAERAGQIYLTWGIGLLGDEQYAASAEVFQRALDAQALPDDNPALPYYLSGALELCDRTDEALAAAQEAIRRDEGLPRLHGRVAWILYHAKRYDAAIESYEALVARFDAQRDADDAGEVVRESRLILSNIYVIQDRVPLAEERLEQVLDEFPEDVSALNDLGYLWADQGKHLDRALRMIEQAIQAEPENIAYLDSLGWVLFRLGRHQEALEPLLKATAGDEPDAVILDHLGDVHLALGQVDQARAAWQRALEKFDPVEDAAKAARVTEKLQRHAH